MANRNDQKFICCLCGKLVVGEWGNNPAPVSERAGARCCNDCDARLVIPARMARMAAHYENK